MMQNDPLRGYYDRVVQKGNKDEIESIRNLFIIVAIEEGLSISSFRQHIIDAGYGSKEAVDIIFPESVNSFLSHLTNPQE